MKPVRLTCLVLIVGFLVPQASSASPLIAGPLPSEPLATSPAASLTPDDWKEIQAAHQAALQQHPELMKNSTALADRMHAFQEKLDAAMIQSDPAIAPVIARLRTERPAPPAANPSSVTH